MSTFNIIQYEPGKNFEELQAKVYNEANQTLFGKATVDQIKNVTSKDDFDPATVRYLFEDEEIKGYVQAKIHHNTKEAHISFPWVLNGVSEQHQRLLYEDLLSYLQHHDTYGKYKIRMNMFANPESNLNFIKKYGFKRTDTWNQLHFDKKVLADTPYDKKYSHKVATNEDIDLLVQLIKTDGRFKTTFSDDGKIKEYFNKVLETGHLLIIFESNEIVGAGAPLVVDANQRLEKRIVIRFEAYKDPKSRIVHIPLVVEIAKECLKTNYGEDLPIVIPVDEVDTPEAQRNFYKELKPEKIVPIFHYYYLE